MPLPCLTKAIVLKEDYTEAYQLRAEVLWGMKQAKDAAEDIQKLLNLNPEDEQACCWKEKPCSNRWRGNRQRMFQLVLSLNLFKGISAVGRAFPLKERLRQGHRSIWWSHRNQSQLCTSLSNEVASNCWKGDKDTLWKIWKGWTGSLKQKETSAGNITITRTWQRTFPLMKWILCPCFIVYPPEIYNKTWA